MRLTVCLEGNTEGRVLASVDMEEIVKMTITDDIEKSNFNPQMLKSCTDTSYQCGYEQGRADDKYNVELFREMFLEELEQQAVDREEIIMYRNICSMAWDKYLEQLKEK